MVFSPGKYDDLCTRVRKLSGVEKNGGGVILMIFGGHKGSGFSVQADAETTLRLPDILEQVAKAMREDIKNNKGEIFDG